MNEAAMHGQAAATAGDSTAAPATLDEVVRLAEQAGWREAVRRAKAVYAPRRTEFSVREAASEAPGDLRFLLPVPQDGVVLNIGTDWGAVSVPLARTTRHVFALDGQPQTLRFSMLRAQQEGLDNLTALLGSPLQIPLADNTCDAALLLDGLEWVPTYERDGSPRALQQQALSEIYRVLRPGGRLCLDSENRFGINYLFGARDPHTGLRFVTVLSRRLADLYSRSIRRLPYREWTLSLREVRSQLLDAQFRVVQVLCVLPGYRDLSYTVRSDRGPQLRFVLDKLRSHARYRSWHGLALRFLVEIGALPAFSPRLRLIAEKKQCSTKSRPC